MKIVTIVGARPQFIKAAVVSRLVRSEKYREVIEEYLVHTGQHYDDNMSDVFFREMDIPQPDMNLSIGSKSHGAMTGAMLEKIEDILLERKPDVVLVYGDTNSTLAGALAASKLHIPVAHVEAGLRSFMMAMPEEQNRILTDRLSTWLFCPTETAVKNLKAEGIPRIPHGTATSNTSDPSADNKSVSMVGDVMFDASLYYRGLMSTRESSLPEDIPDKYYLLTIHRAENTDDPERLRSILDALNARPDLSAIFPAHPRTRKLIDRLGLMLGSHIRVIEPVGYFDMLRLEEGCEFVVTDSGGVQKEAYFFQKPCLTLRDSTEWVELVDNGWNTLVGADTGKILKGLANPGGHGRSGSLYGQGNAGEASIDKLLMSKRI